MQTDLDLSQTYSEIILSKCNNTFEDDLIFPNPYHADELTIECSSEKNEPAKLLIYNTLGELVLEKEFNLLVGSNSYKTNLNGFESGYYQLIIRTNTMPLKTIRFLKY